MHFKFNRLSMLVVFIFNLLIFGVTLLFNHMIRLNGDDVVYIALNDEYHEEGATVNFGNDDKYIKISGKVDNTRVGKYKIRYEINILGINFDTYRTVKVIDNKAPNIELEGLEEVVVCPNGNYKEDGYLAIDNYDGDITDRVKILSKDDVISYSVTDDNGNSISVNRYLNRVDNETPSIKLNGGSTYNVLLGNKFTDPGYTVTDNCDSDVYVSINGSVDTNKVGTYELVYTAVDDSNNFVSIKRYVRVNDVVINNTGVIYLTFDDGPSKSATSRVLDILDKKGIKATFFVINQDDSLDYLIKRAYDSGHTIGLHSYTHSYGKIYSSKENYYEDLQMISDKVESITGEKTMIIRFPGGGSNTVSKKYKKGIMTELTNEVIEKGYRYYDWNVSSGDAGGAKSSDDVYKNVVKGLKKNRNNIVLMHDFSNSKTVGVLEDIIDYGLANGYRFDKIDMTTPMIRHGVNN